MPNPIYLDPARRQKALDHHVESSGLVNDCIASTRGAHAELTDASLRNTSHESGIYGNRMSLRAQYILERQNGFPDLASLDEACPPEVRELHLHHASAAWELARHFSPSHTKKLTERFHALNNGNEDELPS